MSSPSNFQRTRRALIVTPLGLEMRAVQYYARAIQRWRPSLTSPYDYEIGEFAASGTHWEIVFKESGPRNTACSLVTHQALTDTQPELAMLVGIAGGLRDVFPGDVVVPDQIYDYTSGKASESFLPRPRTFSPDAALLEQARRLARDQTWQRWIPAPPERNPSVLCKPLAAGDIVMQSQCSETYRFIRIYYEDAVAVAMEDAGFMEAAHRSRTPAIVVRAISDLLDDKAERDAQGYQEVAATHASAFAFALLASGLPPLGKGSACSGSSTLAEMTRPRTSKAAPEAFFPLLVCLPRYKEQLQQALNELSAEQEIYPGQCRRYEKLLEELASSVRQALAKPPAADYALALRLSNLHEAVQQLQQAAKNLHHHCPPGPSAQERRDYQAAQQKTCQALQKVLGCLERLREFFDRRPP